MLPIKLLVACAIFTAIPIASGAIIHCDYAKEITGYVCAAQTIDNVTMQNEIITIEGTHVDGFGNTDVKVIRFLVSVLNYVPTQMLTIFPSITEFKVRRSFLHTLTTDAFIDCLNLNIISLVENSFPNVAAGFAQSCINTQYVDFLSNEIQTVDKNAFTGLTKLASIGLHNNNITYIDPDTFKKTPAIAGIILGRNQITTLHPDTFSGLSKLISVNMEENKLTYLPKLNLSGTENLSNLNLQMNLIASIDPDFTFQPPATAPKWILNLLDNICVNENFNSGNEFTLSKISSCISITTTTEAVTTTTVATTIKAEGSGTCPSDGACRYMLDYKKKYTCVLENVAYILSSIAGVHEDGFSDLDVAKLYFVNSQLVKVPRIIFDKFPNLEFLSVTETGLTVINDDTFEVCGILKELDASNNQIARINYSSLLKCQSLQWLDLTGNNATIMIMHN